ncbi:response regulator transcription factor [Streptococcus halichoeri]|uniref:response regulator transcription factor n=1 Tax=Streptococcus halichoeri TaxID=254785 RepID=UPI00135B4911|nr:LytTR family DNA-binding domain-containing protein [Streptococcus halichoeri]
MNIFVLEDDFAQQTRIETVIEDIIAEQRIQYYQLNIFSSSKKLYDSIQEKGAHQLFFLDIEIKHEAKKGLELAAEIRKKDPYAVIVFVTTHSEFAPISFRYKVSALDFIDKAVDQDQFKEQIEECIKYTQGLMSNHITEDMFQFETPQTRIRLPYKDILYFATSTTPHKVCLWTKTERLELYGKLSDIRNAFPRLFMCHRSYLVNLENIVRIDKTKQMAYFANGDFCMVSRLKMKALVETWQHLP